MKKTSRIVAAVLAVLIGLTIVVVSAYDSSEDPLVSLSYLNDIFKDQILAIVDNRIDGLRADVTNMMTGGVPGEGTSSGYVVLELHMGDEVYAITPCDIMLRSGTAVCIAPSATQGIADYTAAVEIMDGQPFVKNHMCLIPRGDGRGMRATSDIVYIEIRGEYTVVTK